MTAIRASYGILAAVAALIGISVLTDVGTAEWFGAWLLVLAWLLGRAADFFAHQAGSRKRKDDS